jgi:hypothetical protein
MFEKYQGNNVYKGSRKGKILQWMEFEGVSMSFLELL